MSRKHFPADSAPAGVPRASPAGRREPIAITGIGCRYPGAPDRHALWSMLREGRQAVGEVPKSRFPDLEELYDPRPATPGRIMSRRGAFLDRIDGFDAEFFEIAPREAERLDPQQRLLLEVGWEAFEDAGQPPSALSGSSAGVFVGAWVHDYESLMLGDPLAGKRNGVDFYMTTGSGRYSLPGRLSYFFGFHGPSIAVDTACSSSLVAVHLACQSLWQGECDLALAGGVNVILTPFITLAYSQSKMMAPDGRCKFGDAGANGYVRGEGCGLIVMKPLSLALADGDRIHALIRGSAVNNDGRSSGFLATPGMGGQEDLLRKAYASAGVSPGDVQYIEAHGTGTPVGDPVELGALASVLGQGRPPDRPLRVGSVKTNLGHTEGAAGIAGLIKVALAMGHGRIPASLNLEKKNPKIPWDSGRLALQTEMTPWPIAGVPALAGVSAFGIAGTNGHIVLEQAPPDERPTSSKPDGGAYLVPLSARSPEALRQVARDLSERVGSESQSEDAPSLNDLCHATCFTREHHAYRAAVVADSQGQLVERLDAIASGSAATRFAPDEEETPRKIVLSFAGEGSGWQDTARQLLQRERAFREKMEACDALMRESFDLPLLDRLSASGAQQATEIAQPALFALQVALAELWSSWGIAADAVVGHGMGELAAAHVAGALDLADACRIVCLRARVDPSRSEIPESWRSIRPKQASIPIFSTTDGRATDGRDLDAAYWVRNLREPRHFSEMVRQLAEAGHDVFIEAGPQPTLLPTIEQTLTDHGLEATLLPSMREVEDGRAVMLDSLGRLYALGHPVDWQLLGLEQGQRVGLPHYPWQRRRFWYERDREADNGRHARGKGEHPLLGHHTTSSIHDDLHIWEVEIGTDRLEWLADHRVRGHVVFPAAAFIEMARAAAAKALGAGPVQLDAVEIVEALLPGSGAVTVQLVLQPATAGGFQLRISSLRRSGAEGPASWTEHLRGTVRVGADAGSPAQAPSLDASAGTHDTKSSRQHYDDLLKIGLDYGETFRTVESVSRESGCAFAGLRAADAVRSGLNDHGIHPTLLDAGLQMLVALAVESDDSDTATWLPVRFGEIRLAPAPQSRVALKACATPGAMDGDQSFCGDVSLFTDEGEPVAELRGVVLERLDHWLGDDVDEWLFDMQWVASPHAVSDSGAGANRNRWLILADRKGVAGALAAELRSRGDTCIIVASAESYRQEAGSPTGIDPIAASDYTRLLAELGAGTAPPLTGAIHLFGLDEELSDDSSALKLALSQQRSCGSAMQLARALAATEGASPSLTLVTRGAQPIVEDDAGPGLAQSTVRGLARSIAAEHPELSCRAIDLDPAGGIESDGKLVRDELLGGSDDRDVVLRGGTRRVPRLVPRGASADPHEPRTSIDEGPFTLAAGTAGLAGLHVEKIELAPPRRGEVRIRVLATGLNFRDTLTALGLYPGDAGPLGLEAAGVVTALGDGVEGLSLGDEVVAVGFAAFASHMTASAELVVPKPPSLGFAEAAGIPIVFLTAHYAFHELARLEAGQRVLIHAAAGGVGLAAVQLAAAAGAELFATAGSPRKRAHLSAAGVRHIADSRSLEFADSIRRLAPEGLDVVLNSLSGDSIPASLSLLRQGGSFIEMGKRGTWDAARMARERPDVKFAHFDLAQLIANEPQTLRPMLIDVMTRIREGRLQPLPVRGFPIEDARGAFRYMQQARQIGKIAVEQARAPEAFSPHACYLLTGGLGGLGIETARWLVERGARRLFLAGRSEPSEAASEAIRELERDGAVVRAVRCDAADEAQVERLLGEIRKEGPLRGVFHLAGALDDGALLGQTWERFDTVFRPKVLGAWNLHRQTRADTLDCFVLFSSWASLLGSPGQTNYSAANAFLDALAHHRRARGLAALSINWGAWAEVGLASEGDRRRQLAGRGIGSFTPRQGLEALGRLMGQSLPQVAATPFDAALWLESRSPHLSAIVELLPSSSSSGERVDETEISLRERMLAAESARARRELMEKHVFDELARKLRVPAAQIDAKKSFKSLGLDSLTALELRNSLEQATELTLSATVVWNYSTVAQLAEHLAEQMDVDLEAARPAAIEPADPAEPSLDALVGELESLSDDEVRKILEEAGQETAAHE